MATDYKLNIIATLDTKNVDQQINRLNQSLKTINLGQNGQTIAPQSPVIPTNVQQTSLGNLGALNGSFTRLTSTLDRLTAEVQRLNATLLKPSEGPNSNIGAPAAVVASTVFQKNIPNWTQQVQHQNNMLKNILDKYSVNFEEEWEKNPQIRNSFSSKNDFITSRLNDFKNDAGTLAESTKKLGNELANVSKETDKTNASFKTMRTALGFLGGSYVLGAMLNSYDTIQSANDPIGAKYSSVSQYGRGLQSGLLGMALGGTAGAAAGAKIGAVGGPVGMGVGAGLGFGAGFINSMLPWWLGAGVEYQNEEYSRQFNVSKMTMETQMLERIHKSGSDVLTANWNNWDNVEKAKLLWENRYSQNIGKLRRSDASLFNPNLSYEENLQNAREGLLKRREHMEYALQGMYTTRKELDLRSKYMPEDRENLEKIERIDKKIKELTTTMTALEQELTAVKSLENQRKYILQREREIEIEKEVRYGNDLVYNEEDFANLERSQRYFERDQSIKRFQLDWENRDITLLESSIASRDPSSIINRLNDYAHVVEPYMEKKTTLEQNLSNAESFSEWSSIKEEYDRNQQQLDWFQNRMTHLGDAYNQNIAKQIANGFVNFDATTKGNEISKLAAIGGFGRENTHADRDLVIKVSDIVELLKESNGVGKQIRDMFENNTQGVVFQ